MQRGIELNPHSLNVECSSSKIHHIWFLIKPEIFKGQTQTSHEWLWSHVIWEFLTLIQHPAFDSNGVLPKVPPINLSWYTGSHLYTCILVRRILSKTCTHMLQKRELPKYLFKTSNINNDSSIMHPALALMINNELSILKENLTSQPIQMNISCQEN